MRFDTIVRNGRVVVSKEGVFPLDVAISQGKVAALLRPGAEAEAAETIDARGLPILPGVIDPHVHIGLGDPATDFLTETQAAAVGGVTTLMSYLLTSKSLDDEFLQYKQRGEAQAYVDFALHGCASTEQNIKDLGKYVKNYGVTSYKFFMSFRGEEGADIGISGIDDGFMYDFFSALAQHPNTVACTHAENIEVVWRLRKRLMDAGRNDLPAWTESRPDFVESENALRACYFAEETGCTIYLVHVSNERAMIEAASFRERYPNIYIETCPHYLTHTMNSPVGNIGKINPPLRTQEDIDALWEGIEDGVIDTMGSDHSSRKKDRKMGTIWQSSTGFCNMPVMLPVMLSEGVNKRGLPLERVAELTSYNAAKIFHLYPKKGSLQVGSDADLTIVNLKLAKKVTPEILKTRSDYSLYEGDTLKGWPVLTMVRGKVVMKNGEIVGQQGYGLYLPRI